LKFRSKQSGGDLAAALASIDERKILIVSFARIGDAIGKSGKACGGEEWPIRAHRHIHC
jgi:hypothetical protein